MAVGAAGSAGGCAATTAINGERFDASEIIKAAGKGAAFGALGGVLEGVAIGLNKLSLAQVPSEVPQKAASDDVLRSDAFRGNGNVEGVRDLLSSESALF